MNDATKTAIVADLAKDMREAGASPEAIAKAVEAVKDALDYRNTRWSPIMRGGTITGYVEMFRTYGHKWVTIPDASRYRNADGGSR